MNIKTAWNRFRPLIGPITSSAVVFSAGDVLAQRYSFSLVSPDSDLVSKAGGVSKFQLPGAVVIVERSKASLDWHRLLRATTFGVGISLW